MLVLLLLLSVGIQDVLGIYGGCMSYSTTIESSGHLKVKIFFLNGWKIEKGPCPTCTAADKGSDVTIGRKQLIQQTNNQEMFGKWTAEVYDQNGTASYIDKTRKVNNVSTDVVLIVGDKEGWELVGSEISLDFDFTPKEFDIKFKSFIDAGMTILPALRYINLQVKVDPGIRNDTNRPNRSPVVLVKPLYSLELGKVHTIHLTSVDNDGDAVRCDKALYEESSGTGQFVTNLTKQNLFSLDRMTCVMKITVSQSFFHQKDTLGIAVTVKDYSKHPLSIQGTELFPKSPYISVLGRVVVMMYFKITGITDPPEIIPPTPMNNQEYTIYVGGDFHVDVYAKASTGRKITRFDFLRRDGKPVNHTKIEPASNISDNAVFISMSWSPTELEKGHHILCANAEDNKGRMTVDLHCFRIVVKENIFRPTTTETGKPYFVSFPEPRDLTCKKGTYCRFPVYVTTTNAGGITSIISTPESKENVTIQYSRELINGTIDTKVAQVEFLASQAGARQICLNASDSYGYSERCLYVTVELPDPCASEPCQNLGRCQSFDSNTRYNCSCKEGFTGLLCDKKKKSCDPNPCLFNGNCTEVPFPPYFFCTCLDGRTGDVCQIDRCQANPCNKSEICQKSGKDVCILKPESSHGTTTAVSGTDNQVTMASDFYTTKPPISGIIAQASASDHDKVMMPSSGVGQVTTSDSSQDKASPTVSGQGAITPTTSGQGAIISTASDQGAIIQTASGHGSLKPTASGQGAITSTASAQSAIKPTASGQSAVTPTASGQNSVTPTPFILGTITPTVSAQGSLTTTAFGHRQITPPVSAKGNTAPTVSIQGSLKTQASVQGIMPTSVHGIITTPKSALVEKTPTASGQGRVTITASDHGKILTASGQSALTPTASVQGSMTTAASAQGTILATASAHVQPSQTSSNAHSLTLSISGSPMPINSDVSTHMTTKMQKFRTIEPTTESHCDLLKAKERATNGRVECFCPHPTLGIRTKVISLNPRVSIERLLLAAGLGSGAMITVLGLAALLYVITQKCSGPSKTETESNEKGKQRKKKISVVSTLDKKK